MMRVLEGVNVQASRKIFYGRFINSLDWFVEGLKKEIRKGGQYEILGRYLDG